MNTNYADHWILSYFVLVNLQGYISPAEASNQIHHKKTQEESLNMKVEEVKNNTTIKGTKDAKAFKEEQRYKSKQIPINTNEEAISTKTKQKQQDKN